MMRYVSLFSGIEAASVAWESLGWEPMAFSEIEPFPCAVLRERYPDVPNLGDITMIDWSDFIAEHGRPDLVVGGSPCQSFSIAGNRTGLAGASGLMYEYIRAIQELRPRWLIWENVPGAFSVERGAAFGQLLSSLDDCGYGLAWRVLDAQFCRVPVWDDSGELVGFVGPVAQRRRRVFLVGCLADGCAAEVLLEPEGMSGNLKSSREAREELARAIGRGVESCGFKWHQGSKAGSIGFEDELSPTVQADKQPAVVSFLPGASTTANDVVASEEFVPTLRASGGGTNIPAVSYALRMRSGKEGGGKGPLLQNDVSGTIATGNDQTIFVMASGHSHAEIGRGVISDHYRPCPQGSTHPIRGGHVMTSNNDDVFPSLMATDGSKLFLDNQSVDGGCLILCGDEPIAIDARNIRGTVGVSGTLQAKENGGYSLNYQNPVAYEDSADAMAVTIWDGSRWVVRRLTPVECERLMGFPDGWTDIGDWADEKGKRHKAADGPRYKALGNSFAVPVVRWIAERIEEVDIWL